MTRSQRRKNFLLSTVPMLTELSPADLHEVQVKLRIMVLAWDALHAR